MNQKVAAHPIHKLVATILFVSILLSNLDGKTIPTVFAQSSNQICLTEGTVYVSSTVVDAIKLALAGASSEISFHGAECFAVVDSRDEGEWLILSLVGLTNIGAGYDWSVAANAVWADNVIVHRLPGDIHASIAGTHDFSTELAQIPDSIVTAEAKKIIDPLAKGKFGILADQSYRFPFPPGYQVFYGEKDGGVHPGEFGAVMGTSSLAVDLMSDGNTGANHAPNQLVAAAAGVVVKKCSDSSRNSTYVMIDNGTSKFLYAHIRSATAPALWAQINNPGDSIGELVPGPFNDDACGYAQQTPNFFHVHFEFPATSSLTLSDWTLNTATETWQRGGEIWRAGEWKQVGSGSGGTGLDCGQVSYNGVVLYEHPNCNKDRGGRTKAFSSSTGWVDIVSDFNDITSSIYVKPGWSIKVFQHSVGEGGGSWRCITGSMWDLSIDYYTVGNTGQTINEDISSVQVYDNSSNCGSGGTGTTATWTARYFNGHDHWWDNNNFNNQMCQENIISNGLDKNYGSSAPCNNGVTDNWVAEYNATVNLPAGNYVFQAQNDDGLKIWVNGTNILERGGSQGLSYVCPPRPLGGNTSIRAILREDGGDARVKIAWTTDTSICNLPGSFNKSGPSNGATDQSTSQTISWNSSSGANNYSYCIDTSNNNSCDTGWQAVGNVTSKSLSGLAAGTTYFWHVRSHSEGGATYSNGDAWWSFTTQANTPGAFNKNGPSNNSTGQSTSPSLAWGASSGATGYEYCIDTTNDNACSSWISNSTHTSVTLSNLLGGTTYYWHVRARNSGGVTYSNGSPTAFWSFTTQVSQPPSPPAELGATKGFYADKVLVAWAGSSGASRYEVWRNVNYDTSDSAIRIADNITGTTYSDTTAIPGATYFYWVRACNNAGCSDFSNSDSGYRPRSSTSFNLLMNAGFEDGDATPSWWRQGEWGSLKSTFVWSAEEKYSGNRSVGIGNNYNNDAYWLQTVQVQPNADYLLSGWIKTQIIAHTPDAIDVGANLSVMGNWEYTKGLLGNNDWTYVSLLFNTDARTQIEIAARLGMYSGTTIGIAWFDDLKLELLNTPTCYSLTKNVNPAGSGSIVLDPAPNCNSGTQYIHGTVVRLTASPNATYSFGTWDGAISGSANPEYVAMVANRSVTANFTQNAFLLNVNKAGTGTGTVTSSPSGINCGSICGENFPYNTSVVLTASPAAGSTFAGWSGGGCSGIGTCTVMMSSAQSVTATFNALGNQTLIVTKTGNGTVTSNPAGINCGSDCSESYPYNTVVTLTASAISPFTFGGWSGGGCSGTGSCTVTMNTAQSVMATFNAPGSQTLTVSKTGTGGGTVTSIPAGISCGLDCAESYAYNTSVTLSAVPATGSTFAGWSGACTGTGTCTISMNSNKSVSAAFALNTHALTVTKTGTGDGIVTSSPAGIICGSDCSESYTYNTVVTLTAKPSAGSTFAGWSGGGCAGTGVCTVTMTATRSVTAAFTRNTSLEFSLYMTENRGTLRKVNQATGSTMIVGNLGTDSITGLSNRPGDATYVYGIAMTGFGGNGPSRLVKIDTRTGKSILLPVFDQSTLGIEPAVASAIAISPTAPNIAVVAGSIINGDHRDFLWKVDVGSGLVLGPAIPTTASIRELTYSLDGSILYGTDSDGRLVKVNSNTGVVTVVGDPGLTDYIEGLAFRPSDGALFAIDAYFEDRLVRLNPSDGSVAEIIGSLGVVGPYGLAFVESGPTFTDVPISYWAWQYVERLVNAGVTAGCGGGKYCPESPVTRDQMAVFLLRGIHDSSYNPPVVGGSTGFADVPSDYWAAAWIKQLAMEGITGGCGSGNFCPVQPVTRDQMAVFLLKAKYGRSYTPPPVGGSTGFADVPPNYWAAAWIKQLVAEGITAGCGNGNYCPGSPVTRDQMAVFLVKTFDLP